VKPSGIVRINLKLFIGIDGPGVQGSTKIRLLFQVVTSIPIPFELYTLGSELVLTLKLSTVERPLVKVRGIKLYIIQPAGIVAISGVIIVFKQLIEEVFQ
jgi:hypothetical protein